MAKALTLGYLRMKVVAFLLSPMAPEDISSLKSVLAATSTEGGRDLSQTLVHQRAKEIADEGVTQERVARLHQAMDAGKERTPRARPAYRQSRPKPKRLWYQQGNMA